MRMAFGLGGRAGGESGTIDTPVSIANGGSNQTSYTSRAVLYYDGTRFNSAPWQVETTTLHLIAATDDTYDIGKTSGNRPRNIIASQVMVAGTYVKPTGNARSRISAPSDGTLQFEDATGGGTFARVILGPNSTSGAALKRSTAALQARLGDDSAFTTFEAKTLTATGGTITASAPNVFSQTWNNGAVTFEGVKIAITDTASAAGSLPFQVLGGAGGATNLFQVLSDDDGSASQAGVKIGSTLMMRSDASNGGFVIGDGTAGFAGGAAAGFVTMIGSGVGFRAVADSYIGFHDTQLWRAAANHLALRNSTNAQNFSVYGTYTSESVYNRLRMYYDGSANYVIAPEHVGGADKALVLYAGGSPNVTCDTSGNTYISGHLRLNSQSWFVNTGAGRIQLTNTTFDDFDRLQFALTTSAAPSLKRVSTVLQVRLADDSDFTYIQGQLRTHANAVSEAIIPTHTLLLYDAAGTAYKVAVQAA